MNQTTTQDINMETEQRCFSFLHNGFYFKLAELSEGERWSLIAIAESESDVDGLWPSDEMCSGMANCHLQFYDAGDDPKYPECILRVVTDD